MSESDELLSKADALLARWRSGSAAPRPPEDYPVLTEIVGTPAARNEAPLPEIPTLTEIAESGESDHEGVAAMDATDTKPIVLAPVTLGPSAIEMQHLRAEEAGTAADDLAHRTSPSLRPARERADAGTLDERVRLRVLDAIEPFVANLIEEPLRARIEELALGLATSITEDVRRDILALVREAVRIAVVHELESRRDEESGGR